VYEYPNVPRDAFGHGLIRLLVVAREVGALQINDARVRSAVEAMRAQRNDVAWEVPESTNPAKTLARSLEHQILLSVGGGFMVPVARRWRTQANENADAIAFWDDLPELNHNLVVGLRHPGDLLGHFRAVFIDHASIHPRTRLRYGLTIKLFEDAGIQCERLVFPQEDRLAAQLCAVHYGDLVSYYLALLKGVTPVEIENINWLKDELGKS
jgi:glucose/mannose-6-phosphate isomerase